MPEAGKREPTSPGLSIGQGHFHFEPGATRNRTDSEHRGEAHGCVGQRDIGMTGAEAAIAPGFAGHIGKVGGQDRHAPEQLLARNPEEPD